MRQFETGATRNAETGKYDYEGFLSPLVLERYGVYMHKMRHLETGELRDSDNWQKGIPQDVYIKSAWRHFLSWWKEHRGITTAEGIEDALCALLFNVQGYLHECLTKRAEKGPWRSPVPFPEAEDPRQSPVLTPVACGATVPGLGPCVNVPGHRGPHGWRATPGATTPGHPDYLGSIAHHRDRGFY